MTFFYYKHFILIFIPPFCVACRNDYESAVFLLRNIIYLSSYFNTLDTKCKWAQFQQFFFSCDFLIKWKYFICFLMVTMFFKSGISFCYYYFFNDNIFVLAVCDLFLWNIGRINKLNIYWYLKRYILFSSCEHVFFCVWNKYCVFTQ